MGLINLTECPNSFFYYAFSIMYQIHLSFSINNSTRGAL